MIFRVAGRLRRLFVMMALPAFLIGCLEGKDTLADGRGSETENEVHGILVTTTGAVVSGARVFAFPNDKSAASPTAPVDSAITDPGGKYTLQGLKPGTYNLVGEYEDGPLAVLIPEVQLVSDTSLGLGVDTMKAPGAVDGKVLQGAAGLQGVMVYVPGTSSLAITDAAGYFRFAEIPEGVYAVSYQAPGMQRETVTGVEVIAGSVTHLPTKFLKVDTSAPPPAPVGVSGRLDTLSGQVRLSWNRTPIDDLLGYRVYRDMGALSLPIAISSIITDTFFLDANPIFPAGIPSMTTYRIRTVDRQHNEGVEFSEDVNVIWVSPDLVKTTLKLRQQSPTDGFWMVDRPLRMLVDFSNPTRRVKTLAWFMNDTLVRKETVKAFEGRDSLDWTWSRLGVFGVRVEALDDADLPGIAHYQVQIVSGAPFVYAGLDVEMSVGDSLQLAGKATDSFSPTMRFEWDIGGTGIWKEAPDGELSIVLPKEPRSDFPCIVKATNSFGISSLDTLVVGILADKPWAKIKYRTLEGFPGDTLTLTSEGSGDRFGAIIRREWIVDQGLVLGKSDQSTLRLSSSLPDTFTCILKVTDDDGQSDSTAVQVRVKDNTRWAFWGGDTAMAGIDRFAWWEDSDSIHIMSNFRDKDGVEQPVLWSSSDMIEWTRGPITGIPGLSLENAPVRHLGKIWMVHSDGAAMKLFASENGRDWFFATTPSFPTKLYNYHLEAFDSQLWLFARRDSLFIRTSEVWTSKDGIEWELRTKTPDYGEWDAYLTAGWRGKLWLYGIRGQAQDFDAGLYSSTDGATWVQEAKGIFPGFRGSVSMFPYGGELWMMSTQNAPMMFWGELMHSAEGKNWKEHPLQAPVFGDYGYVRIVPFKGRLWLLSSNEDKGYKPKWEIWQGPFR